MLTYCQHTKYLQSDLTFIRIAGKCNSIIHKINETKHIKVNAGKEFWYSHNGVLMHISKW